MYCFFIFVTQNIAFFVKKSALGGALKNEICSGFFVFCAGLQPVNDTNGRRFFVG